MDQAENQAAQGSLQALQSLAAPFRRIGDMLMRWALNKLGRAGGKAASAAVKGAGAGARAVARGAENLYADGRVGTGHRGVIGNWRARGLIRHDRRADMAYKAVPESIASNEAALARINEYLESHKGFLTVSTDPKTGVTEFVYPTNQERLVANAVEYALSKAVGEEKGRVEEDTTREKRADGGRKGPKGTGEKAEGPDNTEAEKEEPDAASTPQDGEKAAEKVGEAQEAAATPEGAEEKAEEGPKPQSAADMRRERAQAEATTENAAAQETSAAAKASDKDGGKPEQGQEDHEELRERAAGAQVTGEAPTQEGAAVVEEAPHREDEGCGINEEPPIGCYESYVDSHCTGPNEEQVETPQERRASTGDRRDAVREDGRGKATPEAQADAAGPRARKSPSVAEGSEVTAAVEGKAAGPSGQVPSVDDIKATLKGFAEDGKKAPSAKGVKKPPAKAKAAPKVRKRP